MDEVDKRFMFGVTGISDAGDQDFCRVCGCLIGDRHLHREWHERLVATMAALMKGETDD